MVVSSANFTMSFEMCVAAQSCVNKENRRGLSTQPWGVPVLVITVDEVRSTILTTCGLPVRKSKIYVTDLEHTQHATMEREREKLGGMVHGVVRLLVGLVFTGRGISSMLLAPFSHHS